MPEVGVSERETYDQAVERLHRKSDRAEWHIYKCGGIPTVNGVVASAEKVMSERGAGLKDDGGKLPWGLLFGGCIRALRGVVGILQFGAKKYKAHSWKEVENGIERYADAQARHWASIYENGWDARDPETGKLEIDHINCNGMFLGELIRKQYGIKD